MYSTTSRPIKLLRSPGGWGIRAGRAGTSTSRPRRVPGSTWWKGSSRNSPTGGSAVAFSPASLISSSPSRSGLLAGTTLLNPSSGTPPPPRSSRRFNVGAQPSTRSNHRQTTRLTSITPVLGVRGVQATWGRATSLLSWGPEIGQRSNLALTICRVRPPRLIVRNSRGSWQELQGMGPAGRGLTHLPFFPWGQWPTPSLPPSFGSVLRLRTLRSSPDRPQPEPWRKPHRRHRWRGHLGSRSGPDAGAALATSTLDQRTSVTTHAVGSAR